MQFYTYITDTTRKGTADDPAKKFVADNFKTYEYLTIFYGDGKAVVSVGVDDKQIVATPKGDGFTYVSDTELKTSLSSKTSLTTASKLTSKGFVAEDFVLTRDKNAYCYEIGIHPELLAHLEEQIKGDFYAVKDFLSGKTNLEIQQLIDNSLKDKQ